MPHCCCTSRCCHLLPLPPRHTAPTHNSRLLETPQASRLHGPPCSQRHPSSAWQRPWQAAAAAGRACERRRSATAAARCCRLELPSWQRLGGQAMTAFLMCQTSCASTLQIAAAAAWRRSRRRRRSGSRAPTAAWATVRRALQLLANNHRPTCPSKPPHHHLPLSSRRPVCHPGRQLCALRRLQPAAPARPGRPGPQPSAPALVAVCDCNLHGERREGGQQRQCRAERRRVAVAARHAPVAPCRLIPPPSPTPTLAACQLAAPQLQRVCAAAVWAEGGRGGGGVWPDCHLHSCGGGRHPSLLLHLARHVRSLAGRLRRRLWAVHGARMLLPLPGSAAGTSRLAVHGRRTSPSHRPRPCSSFDRWP